jgi:hypothetical protein
MNVADTDILVPIDCVFHVVAGMSTKIIIGNDVLASEGAYIDLGSGRVTFPNRPGSIFIESWKRQTDPKARIVGPQQV